MSAPALVLASTVYHFDVTGAEAMTSSRAVEFEPVRLVVEVETSGEVAATASGPRADGSWIREFMTWLQGYPASTLPQLSEAPQWVRDAVTEVTK